MQKENKSIYCFILIGVMIMAAGIEVFFAPSGFVAGGATGLGIVLDEIAKKNFGFTIPLWLVNILWDIPLLILSRKKIGTVFFKRTVFGCIAFSVALFIAEFLPVYKGDLILICLFGGTFVGVGAGLVLRNMGATGGTDLAAALIHEIFPKISVAQSIFVLDSVIILLGMAIFGIEQGMYAIASVFLTSKWVNAILQGVSISRGALIISKEWKQIGNTLLQQADRGVTAFHGKGLYSNEEKEILLCVFAANELVKIKEIVSEIDKNAFVLITDVTEVLGEGFHEM